MLDDLRDQSSAFFEEEEPDFLEEEEAPIPSAPGRSWSFLAVLSPVQRFIIALMFLLTVCLVGTMFLLVTQRFALF